MVNSEKPSEKVTLSALSLKHKINKSQLRYWTDRGLLKPVTKSGKTQLFDRAESECRLNTIRGCKGLGMTLDEIRKTLRSKR